MWLWTTAALAATPSVRVAWRGAEATLEVVAPEGEKLGADAPARLQLGGEGVGLELSATGAVLGSPVPVGDLRGRSVTGRLEVALCSAGGGVCTPTAWELVGAVPDSPRGRVELEVSAPRAAGSSPFGPSASADPAAEAFARAARSGRPVLLDFSAVWCPPCNLLAAEVLHADPSPAELQGFEVAVLDADHRSSFELKDRYDVGGYPTMVVVDPDGAERTRLVGYPGREATLGWLAGAGGSTDAADLAAGPSAVAPERAAALGWRLLQAGGTPEAAAPWLERARAGGADNAELRLASLAVDPSGADARWVAERAPHQAPTAAMAARELLPERDPEAWRALLEAAVAEARGTEQADLLELRAELAPEGPERSALLAGAAAVVTASLTGDPTLDKAQQTWLASLHERSGHPDRALAVLAAANRTWPDEPTWDLALAPMLLRLGRPEEALEAARRAVSRSWDDNRLRAVAAEAESLAALGRAEESKAVAAAELAAQPEPAPGTNPRTERYRARLRKLAGVALPAGG